MKSGEGSFPQTSKDQKKTNVALKKGRHSAAKNGAENEKWAQPRTGIPVGKG